MVLGTCSTAKSEKVPSTTGHPVRRHRCLCNFGKSNSPALYFTIICDLLHCLWCGFCNRHLKIPSNSSHCFITLPYVLSPDPLRPNHILAWMISNDHRINGALGNIFQCCDCIAAPGSKWETLFQRQRRILPNRSASTLGWTWQPISIFGNFYKLPNMWLQPGRCISLWKICIKTSIFVFLSLENYEQNQYKVSTLEREWAA